MRHVVAVVIVAVLVAAVGIIYKTSVPSPTGRATGGGCGDDGFDDEMGDGVPISDQYEGAPLVMQLKEGEIVDELSPNLLSYVYSLYKFVGHEDLFEAVSFTMITPAEMADRYDGQYAVDSPNLPVGTISARATHIQVFLREGVELDTLLRAVHHELGDVPRLSNQKKIKGQYYSELNRVYMTMAAYAHDPDIGKMLVESIFWPLPENAGEMNSYLRGYLLGVRLLADAKFDLEEALEVLEDRSVEELDELSLEIVSGTPQDALIGALKDIAGENQYQFPAEYMAFVIGMAETKSLFEQMLAAYNADQSQQALEAAFSIMAALEPFPSQTFDVVVREQTIAYNVGVLLSRDQSDFKGVRELGNEFYEKFEPFYEDAKGRHHLRDRGPSTLITRTSVEAAEENIPELSVWARRTIDFEEYFEYEPDSDGAKAIEKAKAYLSEMADDLPQDPSL